MSAMKRFAENVSVEMGFDGELNDEVLAEADRRLKSHNQSPKENDSDFSKDENEG